MYFSISDLKLTQINSAAKGAIFVGTEMYGNDGPSACVVIDGGKEVSGKLVLGLSGKGAFLAKRLEQERFGIELPHADLVVLELSDQKTSPVNTVDVGQLLITTQGAYLAIDWFNGGLRNFAMVNLQTWTLESYAYLMNADATNALLLNWRLVHRHQDQKTVLAESAKAETA